MKTKRVRFTVEGGGEFPYDMLRYDACWPEDESRDSHRIAATYLNEANLPTRRQVTLLSDCSYAPTTGRWDSFNWKVVSQEYVR